MCVPEPPPPPPKSSGRLRLWAGSMELFLAPTGGVGTMTLHVRSDASCEEVAAAVCARVQYKYQIYL